MIKITRAKDTYNQYIYEIYEEVDDITTLSFLSGSLFGVLIKYIKYKLKRY